MLTQSCVTASRICRHIPGQQISEVDPSARVAPCAHCHDHFQAFVFPRPVCLLLCEVERTVRHLVINLFVNRSGVPRRDGGLFATTSFKKKKKYLKPLIHLILRCFFLTFSKWTEYEYLAVLHRLQCFLLSCPAYSQCCFWQRTSVSKTP